MFSSQKENKIDMSNNEIEQIDLKDLFLLFWEKKLLVVLISSVFLILSVIYALSLPNIYSSSIKLVSSQKEQSGGLSSLSSQYGGLAAMAGISLGGNEGSSIKHAIELMRSWPYLEAIIEKYEMKPTFMAVKGWNKSDGELVYDSSLYDPVAKKWQTKSGWFSEGTKSIEPTSYQMFKHFKKFYSVSFSEETGILTISVSHYSPDIANKFTNIFVKEINDYFKKEDQKAAKASISFIENKIKNTTNTQMLEVFYSMIESHTQTLMLTEVSKEYLVKTLIPSKVAEQKSKPNRGMIVAFGLILGFIVSALIVLVAGLGKRNS